MNAICISLQFYEFYEYIHIFLSSGTCTDFCTDCTCDNMNCQKKNICALSASTYG